MFDLPGNSRAWLGSSLPLVPPGSSGAFRSTGQLGVWEFAWYREELRLRLLYGDSASHPVVACRNGKRGQGWERKYMILDGTKLSAYDIEPREGR